MNFIINSLIFFQSLTDKHVSDIIDRTDIYKVPETLRLLGGHDNLSKQLLISILKDERAKPDWCWNNYVTDAECVKTFVEYHPKYLIDVMGSVNFMYNKWNEGKITLAFLELLESWYDKGIYTYDVEYLYNTTYGFAQDIDNYSDTGEKYNRLKNKYLNR